MFMMMGCKCRLDSSLQDRSVNNADMQERKSFFPWLRNKNGRKREEDVPREETSTRICHSGFLSLSLIKYLLSALLISLNGVGRRKIIASSQRISSSFQLVSTFSAQFLTLLTRNKCIVGFEWCVIQGFFPILFLIK